MKKEIVNGIEFCYDNDTKYLYEIFRDNLTFLGEIFNLRDGIKVSFLVKDKNNDGCVYIDEDVLLDELNELLSSDVIYDSFKNISLKDLSIIMFYSPNDFDDSQKQEFEFSLFYLYFKKNGLSPEMVLDFLKDKSFNKYEYIKNWLKRQTNVEILNDKLNEFIESLKNYYPEIYRNLDKLLNINNNLLEKEENVADRVEQPLLDSLSPKELDRLVKSFFEYINAPSDWKEKYEYARRNNLIVIDYGIEECVMTFNNATGEKKIYIKNKNNASDFSAFIHEFIHFLSLNSQIDCSSILVEFPSIYFEKLASRYLDSFGYNNNIKHNNIIRRQESFAVVLAYFRILSVIIKKINGIDIDNSFFENIICKNIITSKDTLKKENEIFLNQEKYLRSENRKTLTGEELLKAEERDKKFMESIGTLTLEKFPLLEFLKAQNKETYDMGIRENEKMVHLNPDDLFIHELDDLIKSLISLEEEFHDFYESILYIVGIDFSDRLLNHQSDFPNQIQDMIYLVNNFSTVGFEDVYEGLYETDPLSPPKKDSSRIKLPPQKSQNKDTIN